MDFTENHLKETVRIAETIDHAAIRSVVGILSEVRKQSGRVFFLGVGGSAANCSHAVNDFRKIAGFEAYTPADNISELTARINDEGMDTSFSEWLKGSRLRKEDCIL
jgi:D-sedoheptulose 7-phosphate isomerase